MKIRLMVAGIATIASTVMAEAQNPLIRDQFTADPTARVFGGRVYLYPSHDIVSPVERLKDWFCMADYHVFSSENLTDWTDHGVILSQENVEWGNPEGYSMWAPECVEKDGKYYFYFPNAPKETRGFNVGVAVADHPEGPFIPEPEPIKGIMGIDPCVLVDDDGRSYIYWSGMGIRGAELNPDMKSLKGESVMIQGLPEGFKEGPYIFKRKGKYYCTFPWVRDVTETLAYAMGDSPLGPFEFKGVIMEEWSDGCWTNHHSIIPVGDDWILFYHHNDMSPKFDKNRSARADYLSFNPDGTIVPVKPTLRGVGITDATSRIELDRWSDKSPDAHVSFLNPEDTFGGWKTGLNRSGAWVRYDRVDFGSEPLKTVTARVCAPKGATLELLAGGTKPLASIAIAPSAGWRELTVPLAGKAPKGVKDITVRLAKGELAEVDWISFRPQSSAGAFPPRQNYVIQTPTYLEDYFTPATKEAATPDAEGFIRRWTVLDPIPYPNRTNTVFTDSYLNQVLDSVRYQGQMTELPRDGQKVKVGKEKLQWHSLDSKLYNFKLYRLAAALKKPVYGVIFNAVTVIDCPEEIRDVRLSAGSNSASMWWINGEKVLTLSGDRRMVADDGTSKRLTLKKGQNVIRCSVINGPGMSDFCARFIDENGTPVTNFTIIPLTK